MPTTLQEFWNENSHRRYPISDTASARDTLDTFTLPDSLMVGMQLCVPTGTTTTGIYYVSTLTNKRLTLDIELSYKPTASSAFVIGSFYNIVINDNSNVSYTFSPLEQVTVANILFSDISGTVVIGSTTDASLHVGNWTFSYISTPFSVSVLDEGPTQVRAIQVDSERFTGNVVLKEGDNMSIVPSYDALTDVTTLTFNSSLPASSSISLLNDAGILAALTSKYGVPVTTINNLKPDAGGNFELQGEDCVQINTGTGVQISNPCSTPCCDPTTQLQAAYESLNRLNLKYGQVYEFFISASTRIADLQGKIAILENQTGFF